MIIPLEIIVESGILYIRYIGGKTMFWRKKKEAKNAASAQERLENERNYEGRIEEIGREPVRTKKAEQNVDVEQKEEAVEKVEKKAAAKNTAKVNSPATKNTTKKACKAKLEPAKKKVARKNDKDPVKEKPAKQEKEGKRQKQEKEEKLQDVGKKAIYRVMYDKDSRQWKIKKDGAKRVIDSKNTKEEALKRVKELSENGEVGFIVHKKDGKFQKK